MGRSCPDPSRDRGRASLWAPSNRRGEPLKIGPGLEADHCFATVPIWGVEGVTGGNERVLAIAGDAADSPYGAAVVPPSVAAAHAVTLAGLSIGRLRASHARDCDPSCSHSQHKECCPRFRVPVVAVESLH